MRSACRMYILLALGLGMVVSRPSSVVAQARDSDGGIILENLGKQHTHIYSAVYDKDRDTLVTAGQGPSIQTWHNFTDPKNREVLQINLDEPVKSVVFAKMQDGASVLVSGDLRNHIRLWDPVTGKARAAWRAHDGTEFYRLGYSMRDKVLVSSASDQIVRFWALESRKDVKNLKIGLIYSIEFSPDGKLLALANQAGELHVLAYPSLKTVWKRDDGRRSTGPVDIAPDGKTMITPELEWPPKSWIRFWDAQSGTPLGKIEVHHEKRESLRAEDTWGIYWAKYSPTGLVVASGGGDSKLYLCEVATKQILATFPLSLIVFLESDDKFVATNSGGEMVICDLDKVKKPYRQQADRITPAELETRWNHLQSGEPWKAIVAVEFFLKYHKETLPFLRENTRNEKKPSQETIAKSMGELASNVQTVRDRASKELEINLYHAEPMLRESLKNPKDLEQRRRIEGLLAKLPTLDGLKPAELRPLRVITILERIPSIESTDLLTWMSKEAESTLVRSEATRALRNLGVNR